MWNGSTMPSKNMEIGTNGNGDVSNIRRAFNGIWQQPTRRQHSMRCCLRRNLIAEIYSSMQTILWFYWLMLRCQRMTSVEHHKLTFALLPSINESVPLMCRDDNNDGDNSMNRTEPFVVRWLKCRELKRLFRCFDVKGDCCRATPVLCSVEWLIDWRHTSSFNFHSVDCHPNFRSF